MKIITLFLLLFLSTANTFADDDKYNTLKAELEMLKDELAYVEAQNEATKENRKTEQTIEEWRANAIKNANKKFKAPHDAGVNDYVGIEVICTAGYFSIGRTKILYSSGSTRYNQAGKNALYWVCDGSASNATEEERTFTFRFDQY